MENISAKKLYSIFFGFVKFVFKIIPKHNHYQQHIQDLMEKFKDSDCADLTNSANIEVVDLSSDRQQTPMVVPFEFWF